MAYKYEVYFRGDYLSRHGTKNSCESKIKEFASNCSNVVPCDFRIYTKEDRLSCDEKFNLVNNSWI